MQFLRSAREGGISGQEDIVKVYHWLAELLKPGPAQISLHPAVAVRRSWRSIGKGDAR